MYFLKKNIILFKKLTIFCGLFLFLINACYGQGVGVERWKIKTLTDTTSKRIDFNIINTNIQYLRSLSLPEKITQNTPRQQFEQKCFKIRAKVLEFKKQEDSDCHLIVCDPNDINQIMIVEIILPKHGNNLYYNQFKKVRDELNYRIKSRSLRGKVFEISGIAFFDILHNQKGKAPNGIELHPVLEFKFINN